MNTMTSRHVTLYHAAPSRSSGVLALLEELGAEYSLHTLDFARSEQLAPQFLAVNPMGKVPTLLHDGAVVTEQVAIYLYLADLYSEAGLAPAIGDPLRGPYLRWLAFYGSCFEPAVIDCALKRDAPPRAMSPYVDFATVMAVVNRQLEQGDYLLGSRYSAADVLWGAALGWMVGFGLVEPTAAIRAYIERTAARPGVVRAKAIDGKLALHKSA